MRDATFTLWGLHALGLDWEADDFMQFVADVERNEDGTLQIMYGVRGERELVERTIDELGGYDGATPVRVGNAAHWALRAVSPSIPASCAARSSATQPISLEET